MPRLSWSPPLRFAASNTTVLIRGDPKADSTRLLLGGLAQRSVLDTLREEGEDVELDDIYVGGAFKAFSLVRALRTLGMKTVLVGSQTGNTQDYAQLKELCDSGTVIIDDANPLELAKFCLELDVDLFIGGVKERPIAYKLGIGFCDHNHERKEALAGFEGMLNFAKEVHAWVMSPVWQFVPRRSPAHGKTQLPIPA